MKELLQRLPPDAVKLALVLFLSLFVGLEREEHKARDAPWSFGGVRTFPLIGLVGYATALIAGESVLVIAIGFAVVGAFLVVSYRHKLAASDTAGLTSEASALGVYLIGALVCRGYLWIGTSIGVLGVLLLELKAWLERLALRVSSAEIVALAKFLLLSVVVLPLLPDVEYGRFRLDPYRIWLVVVAVSGLSWASYVAQRLLRGRGGVLASGLLGGAYSSTAATVVLARRSSTADEPRLFAGAIVAASGVMYLRLLVLVAAFDRTLAAALAWPFVGLGAGALAGGLLWARSGARGGGSVAAGAPRNPLELRPALIVGAVFVVARVGAQLASARLGAHGLLGVAALVGAADVDPFVLAVSQSTGAATTNHAAATAVAVAASSNNLAKATYALVLGERRTGRAAFVGLAALAAAGLAPLLAW